MNSGDCSLWPPDPAGGALGRQHVQDRAAALVAEQLAEMLLVKADPVRADQPDEVAGPEGAQRMAGEARLQRQVTPFVIAVQVREVAAAAPGDPDLLA